MPPVTTAQLLTTIAVTFGLWPVGYVLLARHVAPAPGRQDRACHAAALLMALPAGIVCAVSI